ncbi:hypothetical protein W911_01665 [Hyphomicrobium nitrativorans NL23]|uniref:Uncharacterized protein n=1 Tax=Hyphomicrobium nitrativorans NL23 TaxID=1029756 RepID=V5SH38_9HYPH|nr:hypothetical protein W911_01665 [Hyphomicrobium nitrativorans NL23]
METGRTVGPFYTRASFQASSIARVTLMIFAPQNSQKTLQGTE